MYLIYLKTFNYLSRTLGGSLDENCYCYTLEVSFFSYQPNGFNQPIPYTEEGCKFISIASNSN